MTNAITSSNAHPISRGVVVGIRLDSEWVVDLLCPIKNRPSPRVGKHCNPKDGYSLTRTLLRRFYLFLGGAAISRLREGIPLHAPLAGTKRNTGKFGRAIRNSRIAFACLGHFQVRRFSGARPPRTRRSYFLPPRQALPSEPPEGSFTNMSYGCRGFCSQMLSTITFAKLDKERVNWS